MGYNIINNLFAAPQTISNQADIKWSSTSVATTFFDATAGTDLPAISGYILVNSVSAASAVTVTFLNGTNTLKSLTVANGNYQAFYAAGANTVQIASAVSAAATGDLNIVFSNNPF